ncbi:response regulator [Paenibacillus lutrae]|uniref:Response regulator n=1 Tax=Paenibacillus lutrae TaxID=2078573 RepID=A0A7X3FH13_9BACL|nr:response regulator [Paenibacillus lutrae]MVO99593.1 response regulator [Paenibacillus lutrae]
MNMNLKALLVDDEINILRNLQIVIPWEKHGIEVIGLAHNGVKALEMVQEHQPDLVLSDIRMPLMDGIGFLEKVSQMDKDIQVILLTGFQEFEYARSALKFGAKDYILKPINYEELEAIVVRIATEIREKRKAELDEQKKWSRVKHLAYEKFLFDILLDYTNVSTRHFFEDDNSLEETEFTFLLIDLDNYSQLSRKWSEKERKLENFAVRNVLQDALGPYQLLYSVLQTREGEWCVLIRQLQATVFNRDEVYSWSDTLQNAVKQNVKLTVSVGIYPEHLSVLKLAEAYKKLQRSLQLSPNVEQILMLEETNPNRNELNNSLWELVEGIVSSLKRRDKARMEATFEKLNESLRAISEHSYLRVEQILHFLILHLIREMREISIISDEEERALWANLERSVGVKDLLATIHQLINDCMSAGMNRKPSELLMLNAKEYISKNLSNDFGVEEIADHLGISCSYFSLLFKQHFSETFLEYLTRQRIELSKSLLRMSDKSITQIGKQVGYAERRYFTRVFFKFTGKTPSEYREQILSE